MYNQRKEKPGSAPYPAIQNPPVYYPSQSTDFIPLHLGGLNMPQYPAPFRGRGGSVSGGGGGGYYNQTGAEYQQRRNWQPNGKDYCGGHGNYNRRPQQHNRGGFQQRFQYQPQGHNGGRQFHQQKNHQGKVKNENRDIFREYFHQSMLEDPWKELVERHEALNSSSFSN